ARAAYEPASRHVEGHQVLPGAASLAAVEQRREASDAEESPGVQQTNVLGVVVPVEAPEAAGQQAVDALAQVHVDGQAVDQFGEEVGVRVDARCDQAGQRAVELDLRQERQVLLLATVVLHRDVVEQAELPEVTAGQAALAGYGAPLAVLTDQRDHHVTARQRRAADHDPVGDGVAAHGSVYGWAVFALVDFALVAFGVAGFALVGAGAVLVAASLDAAPGLLATGFDTGFLVPDALALAVLFFEPFFAPVFFALLAVREPRPFAF